MVRALKANWIPFACVAFVLANVLCMAKEVYWLNLLPAALLVAWALVAAADKVLLFIVFATPLSINLEQLDLGGIGVSLPTEPLMVAVMLLFLLKVVLERGAVDLRVLRHPITVVILLQLAWMALCILPSSMPLVSVKYLAARLWFLCTMYFMATRLFEEPRNMQRFFWLYTCGLAIVIGYTLVNHAQYRFEQDPAHWVMSPFFKDHTSYGAIIAFFLPFAVTAIGMPGYSRTRRGVAVFFLLVLTAGMVFSYTRAAWVGVAGALALFLTMRLRVPGWVVGAVAVVAGAVYFANQDRITIALERNRDESSDDLAKHVSSIGNIRSDASNLERINRWNSALRMYEQRPVMGWGPGTYMFQYAPFQAARDRTIISTNFGLNGNAHSEFLGPLAEQGLPGMLLVVVLVGVSCWTAVRLYSRLPAGVDKRIVGAAFFGLVTYYIHGTLNNFLDLDKASVPFWGFTAMIVVLDLKYPARQAFAQPPAPSLKPQA
ncbi:MAG: O-antigen ligase family protein [Bacteroidetes bacterium]|nr:O-antigen ligase family protein [Bacteroidota bacterium]